MKKWLKWTVISLISIAVIGGIIQSKYKPFATETVLVKKTDVLATVVEKGKLTSLGSRDISSEVQGKVLKADFEVGTKISKGTLLAALDMSDIDDQIKQLRGQIKAYQGTQQATAGIKDLSQIKQQEALLEQAKVNLKYAQDQYKRNKALFDQGVITSQELEQAQVDVLAKQKLVAQYKGAVEQMQTNLAQTSKQNQGNLLQFQGQVASINAQIEGLQRQKQKGKIYANITGVIFAKKVNQGDFIMPGAVLYTIGQVEPLVIEAYVNSKDLVNIKVGTKLKVTYKVADQDVPEDGEITKIAPVAEEQLSALGIAEDKIKVTIKILQKPENFILRPGIEVDVTFITQQAKSALAVPKEVIYTDNGQDYLWVVRNGTAHAIAVEKGVEGDNLVEVKKGVNVGEQIILNPHQTELKEGLKVTIISPK